MNNISMTQALGVWTDLEDARHGCHGFGGDTAEIYAYRLSPCDPLVERALRDGPSEAFKDDIAESLKLVKQSLVNLLLHFENIHEDIKVYVDGHTLRQWSRHSVSFTHRAHVRIVHKKTKGRRR